jgi:hypothetical protein
MFSVIHTEKLSVGTEGYGFSIKRNDGLKFKIGEIGVYTFHPKALGIVKTMKQTKKDSV